MTENEIAERVAAYLDNQGLTAQGWTFEFVDECGNNGYAYGMTDQEKKLISLNRMHWPTYDHNIDELIRHEAAHALVGHGVHNVEWAQKLEELGGCYKWLEEWDDIEAHEFAHEISRLTAIPYMV